MRRWYPVSTTLGDRRPGLGGYRGGGTDGRTGPARADPCGVAVRRRWTGSGSDAGAAEAKVTVVEPEGWDDMRRSLEAGWIEPVGDNPPPTACDSLQTTRVSPLTFEVLARRGAEGVAVSEADVAAAQRFAAERLRLVVEPGGAVALAALLTGRSRRRTGCWSCCRAAMSTARPMPGCWRADGGYRERRAGSGDAGRLCLCGGGVVTIRRGDRRKGVLMLVMAVVLVGNVLIWTM